MNENKLPKVSIVGAGNVGSTCAFLLAVHSLADIYLFDKLENLAKAKALDIGQAAVALESKSRVIAASSMEQLKGSQIIIIAAGLPRKPGMSRQDLVKTNGAIAKQVASAVKEHAPNAIVIVVSNPLDILTWVVLKETAFDRRQVFGMAGVVDNSRLRYFTAQKAKLSANQIKSHVLGLHFDQMVIPAEQIFAGSRPITEVLDQVSLDAIIADTRDAGAQIVRLLQNGSAYYMPGAGAFLMAKAVLNDTSQIFDASVYLEGEYGLNGVCLGVPVAIGKKGIAEVKEISLSEQSINELKENTRIFKEEIQSLSPTGRG